MSLAAKQRLPALFSGRSARDSKEHRNNFPPVYLNRRTQRKQSRSLDTCMHVSVLTVCSSSILGVWHIANLFFLRSLAMPRGKHGRTAKSGFKGQPLNIVRLIIEAVRLTGSAFFNSFKNGFSRRRKDRKEWKLTI